MIQLVGALVYLRVTTLVNVVRTRLSRLRQPKYLLGAVVGVAYLYFVFFNRVRPGGPHGIGSPGVAPNGHGGAAGAPLDALAAVSPFAMALAAGGLTILALLCWIGPRRRASLSFTEAEIGFLFPAPLSRKALIHYRLISLQLATFVTALVIALLSGKWGSSPGGAGLRILGSWILIGTVALHVLGSSFVITKLADRGLTPLRRLLVAAALLGTVAVAVIAWDRLVDGAPVDRNLVGPAAWAAYSKSLLSSGPLHWLTWPARAVLRPIFAGSAAAFAAALGPALLVYAAHYYCVLHVNVSFEEASLDLAAKRAARIAALRAGQGLRFGRSAEKAHKPPFALRPAGRPELAFLWKNLLSTADYLRPRTALAAAALIALGGLWLDASSAHQPLTLAIDFVAAAIAGYLLVLGPMFARQDFRRDLVNADLLKVYPLRAWQIVAGEMLTPVVVITTLVWLLLLAVALTFQPPPTAVWFTPRIRAAVTLDIALAVPFLCALEVLIINAATLLYPAWLTPAEQRSTAGIEGIGLRIVFVIGQFLVLGLALVPAAVLAAVVFVVGHWLVGTPLVIVLVGLVVLAVLAAELTAGILLLGRRFEAFDLSAELKA